MSPPPAGARHPFQYAVLRVVPLIERGECLNAGVVVHCRSLAFLAATVGLDDALLQSLAPALDVEPVRHHLEALPRIAAGDPGAGPIAALDQAQRFHWLVAPSSTVIQASAVHTGLSVDPARALDHLFARLVLRS